MTTTAATMGIAACYLEPQQRVIELAGSLDDGHPELAVRTTDVEVLRWRLGRRSRAQMAAMDWTGEPAPVLGELHIFGPAADDLVE